MYFISLLIITIAAIAGSAAYFSIYGLASIFSGTFIPVIIMGTSLECGKLIAVSFLYRYWNKLTFSIKIYLFAAIFVLMAITSAGIFGFLSMGHEQDILPLQQKEQQITLFQNEKNTIERLKQERLERKKQIDTDIASLPNNFVTGRQRLMKSYGPELEQIRKDIADYTKQIREIIRKVQELKTTTLEQRIHTGPIIFIANVFNIKVDLAVKWIILLIIFAFDPLAVILTIGANVAIIERLGGKEYLFKKHVATEIISEKDKVVIDEDKSNPIIINQGMSIEELEAILNEKFFIHDQLTPEQQIQKAMVEEMLVKKKIKEKIRNPKKGS